MGIRTITTVTSAATSYDLTTLAAVKDELSISDTSKDATLSRYITAASLAIAQFCNRVFVKETVKDEFWPDREVYSYQLPGTVQSLQLSRWPVGTVTSVTENGEALVDGTGYRVDKENGSLIRLDGVGYPQSWLAWPTVAIYEGGYAEVPADVSDAAVRLVKARYLAKGRDPFLKQESIPGVRDVSYWVATGSDAGNMPPDVTDILVNYRQVIVA